MSPGRRSIFVCQRHRARALHFDLRLEVDGVLVSWAVPRGPSADPADKRLAIRVDDHALEHADFEGATGGDRPGSVIVWDRGTYDHRTTDAAGSRQAIRAALDTGHVTVDFDGAKLRGLYALTRTGSRAGREEWLLVKKADEDAVRSGPGLTDAPRSILTGRTNEDVEAQASP